MPDRTKLTRILSIDGGGIRGIIPGQILIALEEKLQVMDNNPDARISEYFDLFAGTSTGGILTCIYLCPSEKNKKKARYTAREAVNLYMERGDEIFDISFFQKLKSVGGVADEKYDEKELEEALDDYIGDLQVKDLLKPSLISAYDIKNRKAHFFKSHRAKSDPGYNFPLREAARATSRACGQFR